MQKGVNPMNENTNRQQKQNMRIRVCFALAIGLVVSAYIVATVLGKIPEDQQIDAVHFGIIVFSCGIILLLLKPSITDRLKRFEGAGFKLEMLEQVKENQDKQAHELDQQAQLLDDISLMLPLLLPKNERKHLMNLDRRKTAGYKGNSAFRSEIRRLRSIGLLEMLNGRYVGHMKSGKEFDLAHYVQLTDLGHRWVERIKQIEEHELQSKDGQDDVDGGKAT